MLPSFLLLSVLGAAALGSPVVERQAGPSVTIQNGTVVGSSSNGIDSFKGIPFAAQPVGSLRLRPPQTLTGGYGTFDATQNPRSCPQQFFDSDNFDITGIPTAVVARLMNTPFFQKISNAGEDCLSLNIQRPSNATANSKLPVVFWIYGGGFEFGSTSTYDGSRLIQKSTSLGGDVIFVAANYRVSGFGFLAGQELQREGSTNLGLRDQRKALQWVAENIAAFGGDPDKVTIWGESAGSISVFDHTIINRGNNMYRGKPLFRGGIMNSGSVIPALPVNHPKPQAVYDQVARAAGCGSAGDSLACLRSASYETFLNAVSSVPSIISYDSLNLAYLPRPDPNDDFFPISPDAAAIDLENPAIVPVPIIVGDQEDEGTLFALTLSNVSNTERLTDYFASYFPDTPRSVIAGLVNLYPESASAGSPFNTGLLNELYPGFKRNAALLGDATFTLTRRGYLSTIADQIPAWSYLSSYFYGTPILGTFHATDILTLYFNAIPPVADTILTYYISFFNTLNPNGLGGPQWPQWTNSARQIVNFRLDGPTTIRDDFRDPAAQYLLQNARNLRV